MKLITLCSVLSTDSMAQDDSDVYNEAYARAHIAYTDFMRLGVSNNAFVKCVKAVNYFESGIVPKIVNINGEEFRDDGLNYDLKASDGVLTSSKATPYEKDNPVIAIGTYQISSIGKTLYNDGFLHENSVNRASAFIIKCTWVWVSCYTWPENIRELCFRMSWPFYGYWEVKECTLGW